MCYTAVHALFLLLTGGVSAQVESSFVCSFLHWFRVPMVRCSFFFSQRVTDKSQMAAIANQADHRLSSKVSTASTGTLRQRLTAIAPPATAVAAGDSVADGYTNTHL